MRALIPRSNGSGLVPARRETHVPSPLKLWHAIAEVARSPPDAKEQPSAPPGAEGTACPVPCTFETCRLHQAMSSLWVKEKTLLELSSSQFNPMYGPAMRCKKISASWRSAEGLSRHERPYTFHRKALLWSNRHGVWTECRRSPAGRSCG